MPPAAASLLSVLIVGGSGSVGRAILELLRVRYRDIEVFVLDRTPIDFSIHSEDSLCPFDFYCGDLDDPLSVSKIVRLIQPQVIIYCARHSTSGEKRKRWQVNVQWSPIVLDAAQEAGVKAFVWLSPPDANGNVELLPDHSRIENPTIDSTTIIDDDLLRGPNNSSKTRTATIQTSTLIDQHLISSIQKNRTHPFWRWIPVESDGSFGSFTSPPNAAFALILAAESLVRDDPRVEGKIFCIPDPTPVCVQNLEATVLAQLNLSSLWTLHLPRVVLQVVHTVTRWAHLILGLSLSTWMAQTSSCRRDAASSRDEAIQVLRYHPLVNQHESVLRACAVSPKCGEQDKLLDISNSSSRNIAESVDLERTEAFLNRPGTEKISSISGFIELKMEDLLLSASSVVELPSYEE